MTQSTSAFLAIALVAIDGCLLYLLARRYATVGWAAGAALAFALNPATISAAFVWGPLAPAGCGLALLGAYFLVRSSESQRDGVGWRALGWVAIAGVGVLLVHQFLSTISVDSIDDYNLWTIKNLPQLADAQRILFVPQFVWGIGLFVAAAALLVARKLHSRSVRALIESGALLALAFCLLTTRAFERDMLYGLALVAAAIPLAKRYIIAYVVLSFALLVGAVHAQDLPATWGVMAHALSFVNICVFFILGYCFLGQETAPDELLVLPESAKPALAPARSWFDPLEGVARMLRLDYFVALGITVASFLVMFYRYWFPTEKIFDEIYFARAAEEYLTHQYIYENTHPPVTKLLVTLSTWLFGGLNGGDNSHGWRFLGVVFAALSVWMLYALAKRVTRSTLFSAYAAGLLALDGMHFVQARIATPETYVVFFSIATVYTFYRFWIASQVRFERYNPQRRTLVRTIGGIASALLGLAVTAVRFPHENRGALAILVVYFAAGFYLLYRLIVEPMLSRDGAAFASYPDGTSVIANGTDLATLTSDGVLLAATSKPHTFELDELRATYRGDGSVQYDTLAGGARYDRAMKPENALLWLFLFSLSIGLLVASKWYGVMAYGVAVLVVLGVWSQRFWHSRRGSKRPAVWGNPLGFRLDVVLSTVVFVTMSVYFAAYIPSFMGLSDQPNQAPRPYTVSDVVTMQYNAYEYHEHLTQGHPYASKWWQWPLDMKPPLYYAKYGGSGKTSTAGMIYSLPNPFIVWMGLLSVPWVGVLAFRERNKGYALLVLTYLAQWLPWMASPRIAFLYHFYVNIPIICLCNAVLAQRLWQWASAKGDGARRMATFAVASYFVAVAIAFVYFYPILAGVTLPTDAWLNRIWFHAWL